MRDSQEDERIDSQFREAYRQPPPDEAAAARRTLERIRAGSGPRRGVLWAWFAPRAVRVSPALAFALLVALLGGGVWLGARWTARPEIRSPLAAAPAATGPGAAAVTFVLRAPGASQVAVAGDFNGWDVRATPMVRAGSGDTWTVRIAIPRGVHYYSFVLDGDEWRPDPSAPLAPATVMGGQNSVLIVNDEGRS